MSLYPLSRPCPKCGAEPGKLCSNTPAQPCDERWGSLLIDADKLRALDERLRRYGGAAFPDEDKSGREETCIEAADAILAMAEENAWLREDVTRQMAAANSEANRAEELQAENARLREALDPFAAIAEWWGDDFCTRNPDHNIYGAHAAGGNQPDIRVTMVDAVAARQALAATGDPS